MTPGCVRGGRWRTRAALAVVVTVVATAWVPVLAGQALPASPAADVEVISQWAELRRALLRLPLATILASALALRPLRGGTPPRRWAVIHTQILLAVIGALVMLVVGSSLARAFGIVGAAGLVRYRAKIEDPKDAGVMLCTLGVGLACGVGQWALATFGTVFVLALLWVVESFEPVATRVFVVKVKNEDAPALKDRVEKVFRSQKVPVEVRTVSQQELHYEIHWPVDRPTDVLSQRISGLLPSGVDVEFEQKKDK